MKKVSHEGMDRCPICKKEFLHNPTSIYKLVKGQRTRWYCSYTCWRKDGGDSGKPKYR